MRRGDLRFGVRLELGAPEYEPVRRAAALAEARGYDAVWLRDHVSLGEALDQPYSLECFTMMAALARDTRRVRIGSLVAAAPFRNPALLAKMGATIDVISGGRLVLGIGAGNVPQEFAEYGYAFPSGGERLERLDEAIQVIRLLWTEERATFRGRHYRVTNAQNEPKPTQRPHPPIVVGVSGPRALRVVARRADAWHIAAGFEVYRERRELLARYCAAIGRDPTSLPHLVTIYPIIDSEGDRARRRLDALRAARPRAGYLRELVIAGTPDEVIASLQPFLALGVAEFVVFFPEPDQQEASIEAFAEHVIQPLQGAVREG
jgi:probable F420-dependent oxidoreductase